MRIATTMFCCATAGCSVDPGTGGATLDPACEGESPLVGPNGEDTGLVACDDGSIRRLEAVSCGENDPASVCEISGGECENDADCTAGANGVCFGNFDHCVCRYDCTTDADCADDETCVCRFTLKGGSGAVADRSECVPASCRDAGDCDGYGCAVSPDGSCGFVAGFHCHGAADTCRGDADCAQGSTCTHSDADTRWACAEQGTCE